MEMILILVGLQIKIRTKTNFELTLPKLHLIRHVEIDWDRRLRNGQNDPNIKSWSLYYAGQDDVSASGENNGN